MNVSIKDSVSILQLLDRSISMITPIIKWKFKDDKLGLNQIKLRRFMTQHTPLT